MNRVFLLIALVLLTACQKDEPKSELDKLPPATQTGENTFGCLLDGKAFRPGGTGNPMDCVYDWWEGNYYFRLHAKKVDSSTGTLYLVGCVTEALELEEGQTYVLQENIANQASGIYVEGIHFNYTSAIQTGEMHITRFDVENRIVSGTFWYDILDYNGDLHEVREGRFDIHFPL